MTGWWLGTFFIFPYIGKNISNCLIILIFLRGVETTNQMIMILLDSRWKTMINDETWWFHSPTSSHQLGFGLRLCDLRPLPQKFRVRWPSRGMVCDAMTEPRQHWELVYGRFPSHDSHATSYAEIGASFGESLDPSPYYRQGATCDPLIWSPGAETLQILHYTWRTCARM